MKEGFSRLNDHKPANHPPLASIVIPTWNGEKYLLETIRSVCEQTFRIIEILIVDDGSSDSSVQIAEMEAAKDERIKVYSNPKRVGIAGNWNRGLKAAKGDYIKILGQDDILCPDSIQKSVSILDDYPTVSLVCSFESSTEGDEGTREEESFPGIGELDGAFAQQRIIESGNWIGGPTSVMFRRADLIKTGTFDPDLPCSLDWEMWLRLLGYGNLYVIPEILHTSRIHPGQESSNCLKTHGFLKDRIRIFSKIDDHSSLYGAKLNVSQNIKKDAVNRLLRAAKRSGYSDVRQSLTFLRQHQTRLQLMGSLLTLWFRSLWIGIYGNRKAEKLKSQQTISTKTP